MNDEIRQERNDDVELLLFDNPPVIALLSEGGCKHVGIAKDQLAHWSEPIVVRSDHSFLFQNES